MGTEEIKLPNSYSPILVDHFTKRFNQPIDDAGKDVPLIWKNDTPEKSHHYGTNCVHLIANNPRLATIQIRDTEQVINLRLQRDFVQNTYIPSSSHSADSINIRCCFDGILLDQSILHFSSSSRSKVLDLFASKIYFSLLSLAKNQLHDYSMNHVNQFTIFNLIQSNKPKIQWLTLKKGKDDHEFVLKYIYDCCHQINQSMFQPRENRSCLTYCPYKRFCGLFPNNKRR
jgi:hypothetical protein